jgi:hypothetical protein
VLRALIIGVEGLFGSQAGISSFATSSFDPSDTNTSQPDFLTFKQANHIFLSYLHLVLFIKLQRRIPVIAGSAACN